MYIQMESLFYKFTNSACNGAKMSKRRQYTRNASDFQRPIAWTTSGLTPAMSR
jgi:hypothetical protein